MADYAAWVYDLDGTLVSLDVDWAQVREDVLGVYREAGVEADAEAGLWTLMTDAAEHELAAPVERTIARHELAGAKRSTRLPAADGLASTPRPVAVCSLNAEAACRVALETHGLLGDVDVIVGRDTVPAHKPAAEPLLAAVEGLSTTPDRALFIGDNDTDELTAKRAGVDFVHVDERARFLDGA